MNDKIKKIIIPFILMMIFNLGIYYLTKENYIGGGLNPHVGILFISGLLFGPYGALGSVIGNMICDLIKGYSPLSTFLSAIITFGSSYLAYKLWYRNYKGRLEITKPKLHNTHNITIFIGILVFCGFLYSMLHGILFYLLYTDLTQLNRVIELRYFINFFNSSFIFGIIGIWISNKINYVHIPKISKKRYNKKVYEAILVLLLTLLIITGIIDYYSILNREIAIIELISITILLYIYLTKPNTSEIVAKESKSIPEIIMNIFLLTSLFLIVISFIISYNQILINLMKNYIPLETHEIIMSVLVLTDIILLIFFIPSMVVLKYIEKKVIEPIVLFSKIENYIHKNEKIESDKIVDIYSNYINEETEIGTLAQAYTDLITFNNNYIENISEIEGEKERIKAELDIATKIQESNLPTKAIETDEYTVDGYSKPAKEVGGDFFDYYMVDEENLAIVIGDASGKGIPAAMLALITQILIKQIIKREQNPSKVLNLLNNQLSENNSENMFMTLWLGIYNKTTKKLTFSNAGHNPPLIKENETFKRLDMDTGIVLGIIEDYDYINEEIILSDEIIAYTDGITDANNNENEMYGENRLLSFFNELNSNEEPIKALLDDISNFIKEQEQYDDMTILYLKIK